LSGEVRIIGGMWRRTKLKVLDKPGLRPSPDRVRETLFNWLGQELTNWVCVDAFAGTGVLGFESASRGAREVLMLESDSALCSVIQEKIQLLKATGMRIQRGDALMGLRSLKPSSVDLVFLDPPFDNPALMLEALKACVPALKPEGHLYLESAQAQSDEALSEWGLLKHRYLKAGQVHAHLLKKRAL
jgi:16S rRNA (guanine966-N2)-methyltransferase